MKAPVRIPYEKAPVRIPFVRAPVSIPSVRAPVRVPSVWAPVEHTYLSKPGIWILGVAIFKFFISLKKYFLKCFNYLTAFCGVPLHSLTLLHAQSKVSSLSMAPTLAFSCEQEKASDFAVTCQKRRKVINKIKHKKHKK